MRFIEMTGATLQAMLQDDEMQADDLHSAGVDDSSIIRINEQGDIEVRRRDDWDVIGGLLGEFQERLKAATKSDWA